MITVSRVYAQVLNDQKRRTVFLSIDVIIIHCTEDFLKLVRNQTQEKFACMINWSRT